MATRTNTYPDGRKETWDGTAVTFTAWDGTGTQTERRPLSSTEVAALAAIDKAATAKTQLTNTITSLTAAKANVDAIAAKPLPALSDITALAQVVSQIDQVLIQLAQRVADQMGTH